MEIILSSYSDFSMEAVRNNRTSVIQLLNNAGYSFSSETPDNTLINALDTLYISDPVEWISLMRNFEYTSPSGQRVSSGGGFWQTALNVLLGSSVTDPSTQTETGSNALVIGLGIAFISTITLFTIWYFSKK